MGAKIEYEVKKIVCSIVVLSLSVWWYSHKSRDL